MNATVTIGIEDFQGLQNRIKELEGQLAAEKVAHEASRLGDAGADARRLADGLNMALEVVRFAIGNLHPMTVRGWPYEALRALGNLVESLPGVDPLVKEVARGDWGLLTAEMEKWELARAAGLEQELLAEENAARAPGPDHPAFGGAVPA